MKNNITFAVLAYNEEKRIAHAVKNLRNYGDVVILDGGSMDRTKEIAESLGATFLSRPETTKPYVESEQNFAFLKQAAKTDWIYWGYADNLLPKKLLEKMVEITNQDTYKIVYAPLHTYLWGNTDNYVQKSGIPVLFHRDHIDFSHERIHSMGDFTGTKEQALSLTGEEYAVQHFSVYDMRKFVMGHMRYAEVEAGEKFAAKKKFSLFKMFGAMIRYMWIYRRSILGGDLGIIILFYYAFFRLMAYTKLYELEHDITIPNVERKYEVIKEKLMKDFE